MRIIIDLLSGFFIVVFAGAILGVIIFNRKSRCRLPRRTRGKVMGARTKIHLPKEPDVAGDGAWPMGM